SRGSGLISGLRKAGLRKESMIATQAAAGNGKAPSNTDFDAIIIGAGVSGLCRLHRLHQLGLRVRVFESGTGGTCTPTNKPARSCATAAATPPFGSTAMRSPQTDIASWRGPRQMGRYGGNNEGHWAMPLRSNRL